MTGTDGTRNPPGVLQMNEMQSSCSEGWAGEGQEVAKEGQDEAGRSRAGDGQRGQWSRAALGSPRGEALCDSVGVQLMEVLKVYLLSACIGYIYCSEPEAVQQWNHARNHCKTSCTEFTLLVSSTKNTITLSHVALVLGGKKSPVHRVLRTSGSFFCCVDRSSTCQMQAGVFRPSFSIVLHPSNKAVVPVPLFGHHPVC